MTKINFLCPDRTIVSVDAEDGSTVMETAVREGIDGIVAECGGACACATCHVYVDDAYSVLVGPPSDFEDELLEGVAAPRRDCSRLSCQIEVRAELDGLVVEIAPEQL